MKKEFKKFLITVFTVIIILMSLDFTFGKVMDWMLPQISNQGDTGKTYFSLNEVNTPIVIVGSSRASHHYVTQMIEDSLGMPAYNVGRDGCFFSYNCCVVNSILDRYSPKLIIWENGTEYLYNDNSDPLENLYPYFCSNEHVNTTIHEELPWNESFKVNSRCYQFNSVSHRVLMRYFKKSSFYVDSLKGYSPLAKKELKNPLTLTNEPINCGILSQSKIKRFETILSRAHSKGIKLIIVDSPKYMIRCEHNVSAEEMKRLCQKYEATFIDNSQLSFFLKHPELFNDNTHLNDDGALVYTRLFIQQINV